MNHTKGTTTVHTTGSRWVNEKGDVVTVSNPGDTVAVQWVYVLVGKE